MSSMASACYGKDGIECLGLVTIHRGRHDVVQRMAGGRIGKTPTLEVHGRAVHMTHI